MRARKQRARLTSVRPVARNHLGRRADRAQPRLEPLTVARHAAAARREQHARRAPLNQQRRRAKAEAAEATRHSVRPAEHKPALDCSADTTQPRHAQRTTNRRHLRLQPDR